MLSMVIWKLKHSHLNVVVDVVVIDVDGHDGIVCNFSSQDIMTLDWN